MEKGATSLSQEKACNGPRGTIAGALITFIGSHRIDSLAGERKPSRAVTIDDTVNEAITLP